MKIHQIELRHVGMKLKAPFETSFGIELDRECLILRVTGDGVEGWGECVAGSMPGYSYETTKTAWHVLSDFFIPAILGSDISSIQQYVTAIKGYRGHNLARAGLEMALWDLLSRADGKSVADAIGGVASRVPVGVSIGIQENSKALVKAVGHRIEQGYGRIKIKIKPGRDLSEVQAVRQAFPEIPLQVDANSAYSLEDREIFKALDNYRLLLIEQPLAEDDLVDHSRLQAELNTPICLDESILSERHARQAIHIDACRVVNIKQGRVGGLQESIAIHDICRMAEVPVWCGGMLETGIGRAANLALASLPGFSLPGDISATDRYYEEDIATPRFILNPDSTINVPTDPGLGITVDLRALDKVTLKQAVFKQ